MAFMGGFFLFFIFLGTVLFIATAGAILIVMSVVLLKKRKILRNLLIVIGIFMEIPFLLSVIYISTAVAAGGMTGLK